MVWAAPGPLPEGLAVEFHGGQHDLKGLDPVFGLVPINGIILWSGAIADIPYGWKICDGTNGTPDLRDRFVVGAGLTYAKGATGGSTTQANHVVTDPATHSNHRHTASVGSGSTAGVDFNAWKQDTSPQSSLLVDEGSTARSHSGTAVNAHGTNLPPYFALAYIMRTI